MAVGLWWRASIVAIAVGLLASIVAVRISTSTGPALGATSANAAVPIKIMPLGDSITLGNGPDHSYRGFLQQKLTAAGYAYDFGGSY